MLRYQLAWLLCEPLCRGSEPGCACQVTGFWGARVIGVPESAAGEPALAPVIAQLGDRRDPGYWSTARMVLEAGLTLALNVRHLTIDSPLWRALPGGLGQATCGACQCIVLCSACSRGCACSAPGSKESMQTASHASPHAVVMLWPGRGRRAS